VFRSASAALAIYLMVAVLPGAGPSLAASPAADELVALANSGGKPLIADFGLGFCMQCRKQAETLKEIREAYGDKVILRMVNVGKERLSTRFRKGNQFGRRGRCGEGRTRPGKNRHHKEDRKQCAGGTEHKASSQG